MKKYKLYCTTDSTWENVIASNQPTKCPINAAHTIDSDSISSIVETVSVNDGTAKELTLADYMQLRYNEIDGKSGALIAAGFAYDSKTFSLSLNAQTNWNALKDQEAEFTWPVDITTTGNDTYSLAQANLDAFWTAARDITKGHLDSGRALKKSIYDATDEAGVDAVVDSR